jgi:hypothetical protein
VRVSKRNTLETNPANTVLLVGGTSELLETTRRAARSVPTADVVFCELRDAPTRVAELWPFAMVMNDDLYAFDSSEFDALARDVKARLIIVGSTDQPLEPELSKKILEAFRRRMG